ncbi:MATE family efflux transporter [Clostridium polynesiense]|uniref:MATE family efflux transporter n=1 Tax=Clostridium polynesiense TaxID=1325933 RepID=UPI00058F0A50|nr:MATE family efflux transporter [Clostridium polynesiense]
MSFNFKALYSGEYMIKEEQKLGSLPSDKKLYTSTMNIAMPAMIDTVLIGLVSMVDTIMVGSLGAAAIAAVGITNQPKLIILATFASLNIGVTAIVARRKGQNDRRGANRCLGQALMISSLLSMLFSILGVIFAEPMLLFAGSQADMILPATTYFKILMAGIPFSAVTLAINAAQRGSGNTKISMRINITANIVNMVFNYLLIGGNFGFPALGVAGAAAATVLGNIVGFTMALISISSRQQFLHINIKEIFIIDKEVLKPMSKIALSAGVEQVFMRIGFFLYIKIVASLGTVQLATHNICMSLLSLSFSFSDGLGIAASSLIGQSLGRKRADIAIIYGKACQRVSLAVSAGMVLMFTLGGKGLVSLFSTDSAILAMASPLLIIMAVNTPIQYSQVIFSNSLRGAGDTKFTAVTAMISIGIVRPIVSWMLCYPLGLGLTGAWLGLLLDQSLRFLFSYFRFSSGNWCKITV